MAEIRMTWKVRAALKIYDSFTRKPATLSMFRVTSDAGLTPIKKPEGILVFVENHNFVEKEQVRITLESPFFLKEEIDIFLGESPQVTVLWMNPGQRYPAPAQSAKLYGRTERRADLSLVFPESHPNSMKLLRDYRQGDQVMEIYHPGIGSLEGCMVELETSGKRIHGIVGREMEKPKAETGIYQAVKLDQSQLKDSARPTKTALEFPKMETSLRLVYRTRANEEGMYLFFFKNIPMGTALARLERENPGKEEVFEVRLQEGKSVRLDLKPQSEG